MAFWQTTSISDINIGTSPNDGTGDNIRLSFTKVDSNFSNISGFLAGTRVDFLNANISYNLLSQVIFIINIIGNIYIIKKFYENRENSISPIGYNVMYFLLLFIIIIIYYIIKIFLIK